MRNENGGLWKSSVERSRKWGEEKSAGYAGLDGTSSRLYCIKQ